MEPTRPLGKRVPVFLSEHLWVTLLKQGALKKSLPAKIPRQFMRLLNLCPISNDRASECKPRGALPDDFFHQQDDSSVKLSILSFLLHI